MSIVAKSDPFTPAPRRGRSQSTYTFTTHAAGKPVFNKPYNFIAFLKEENDRVIEREEAELQLPGDQAEVDAPLPNPALHGPLFKPAVEDRGRDSSPEGYTERDSSPERDFSPDSNLRIPSPSSSPPPLEAVLCSMDGTPTVGDTTMDVDSEDNKDLVARPEHEYHSHAGRSVSPTVSDFFGEDFQSESTSTSPTTSTDVEPSPRTKRLITYLMRKKKKYGMDTDLDHKQAAALRQQEQAEIDAENFLAITQAITTPTRRSRRLRTGRAGDSTEGNVWTIRDLIELEFKIYEDTIESVLRLLFAATAYHLLSASQPLIDNQQYVIGVIAGGPKNTVSWWGGVVGGAFQSMRRLYHNGDFSQFGEGESLVRVGLDYGVNGVVHFILIHGDSSSHFF
ncbi:hypothetical protein C8J57DRAFT_1224778 [Mycena rebaudengoi]|nr:hypothetical protein C8J57DRAFT_1224778 [Mycena rebaudengoi]